MYSASNLVAPPGTVVLVKTKAFKFLWRNKKDKIKRPGLYQDPDTGGIRMPYINIMFKALKLAWIPRLMNSVKRLKTRLNTISLNAHLLEPLSKKSYNDFMKPTLVRFVLPPRNSCSVCFLAPMKQH